MEKLDLVEDAAALKNELIEVVAPVGWGRVGEIAVEAHVDFLRACSLAHTRRRPRDRLRKGLFPAAQVSVVDEIRRDQMRDWPERFDAGLERSRKRDRRPDPQSSASQAHDRHPRGEGEAAKARVCHPNDGPSTTQRSGARGFSSSIGS
ncbi:hypothetical protein BH11MYX1_BH11MYX1_42090 [soil metagenome]